MSPEQILASLLSAAAEAHHVYEQETGKPDDDWAAWYAEHMLSNPAPDGWRLTIHR